MARVKFGSLVSSIEGQLGGSVFQKNVSGYSVRQQGGTVNRNTFSMNQTRVVNGRLQNAWRSLSQSDQATWQAFANYNPVQQKNNAGKFINGQAAFLRINYYRLFAGFSILTIPIFDFATAAPFTVVYNLGFATLEVQCTGVFDNTTDMNILFATAPLSIGINNPRNFLRQIPIDQDNSNLYDITAAYTSLFGRIPTNDETVWFRFSRANRNNGNISPYIVEKVTF
jgi:hypothetical protein